MATFSIEIADEHAPRLIAALCGLYDYAHTAEEGEDPAAFANRAMREYLSSQVARWEASQAAREAARRAAEDRITINDPARSR